MHIQLNPAQRGPTLRVRQCLAVISAVLFAAAPLAANGPPEVTNVHAEQRLDASGLVDITYDLADGDDDLSTITLLASNDSGTTWIVPITAVAGDVGAGIAPGTGKRIEWNPAADLPGVSGTQFQVRIIADDYPQSAGMTYVVAGNYDMGDHHDGMADALPVHGVHVDAFYVDVYEVTSEKYCAFLNSALAQGLVEVLGGMVYKAGDTEPYCDTTSSSSYSRITWNGSAFGITAGKENHPMVMVSWYGAVAYANWRSNGNGLSACYDLDTWGCTFDAGGYRLPTEAEWEKAARGGENSPYYRYPWGDGIHGSKANYLSSGDPFETGPYPWTTPKGYYDGNQVPSGGDMANGYGLYDMAGNVWEWCNDWHDATYYSSSPYDNPKGPASGPFRVIRSGSWGRDPSTLRSANRYGDSPTRRSGTLGFRILLPRP